MVCRAFRNIRQFDSRVWLIAALLSTCLVVPPVHGHAVGQHMATAAKNLLAALSDEQRAQATFEFADAERQNWHFIPKDDRRGVALRDMTPPQQQLTFVLLNSALSHTGFSKALTIMTLEQILHEMEHNSPTRDPEKYYVSIFGTPGNQQAWGWRIEGHHLSVNFTIKDGNVVSSTPSFFGTNPAHVRQGPRKGLAVLGREENLARQLAQSLDSTQREIAILKVETPSDVIIGPGRDAQPLEPLGISFTDLNDQQKKSLRQLMRTHFNRLNGPLAKEYWARIVEAGWDNVHFAWAGSLEPRQGHYYRVQGPTFLLEYDNTQNDANHVHCVWRDMQHDFGGDLLHQHYEQSHGASHQQPPINTLTEAERRSGWRMLFNGKSTEGWRNYRDQAISGRWNIVDGALQCTSPGAGDIVTTEEFANFELSLEYKISPAGNSGIMFRVTEDEETPWQSGPEVQVQDNVNGHDPQKSGWLYQLYQPTTPTWSRQVREKAGLKTPDETDVTRPPGEWNQVYLRVSNQQCEVAMNGVSYYYFKIGDEDWNKRVAKSKFAAYPNFGKAPRGHICLQDHGNVVAYRNIKIRELEADGSVPRQPIDGTLPLRAVSAFPRLEWENWHPVDESGRPRALRLIELTYSPDDPHRIFVATQRGAVYTFLNDPSAQRATLVLDIREQVRPWWTANETGLLGLALHPQFADNGKFYVYYTSATKSESIVSEFRVSASNRLQADPQSERVLMRIEQPFENHNGGSIAFGPDGYLYIALGDGGDRNDPLLNGQDLSTWLGSILRIDVNRAEGDKPYGIPPDNPFVKDSSARPEIFAYGFRNPWRIAFDRQTGDLWVGDVGQDLWEEIDIVQSGGNYGWSQREGTHLFSNIDTAQVVIAPVWEYDHQIGKSITGGRVYRGSRLPQLQGMYLYADYVSGKLWALDYDRSAGRVRRNLQILAHGAPVLAFGEDSSGEVYFLTESATGDCIQRFEQ